MPKLYWNPRVQICPSACIQNAVLSGALEHAGRVISTYLRLESESEKSVFGNSVFPGATNFEGHTQAESCDAVSSNAFFVEKNYGSQYSPTANSTIFASFLYIGKNNKFQNVVRNLNFKKSLRGYIGFRMGVPDVELDLGYIYPKYPPKTLNKRSTYGKFFYIVIVRQLHVNGT